MYNNTLFWKMFAVKIALIESALIDSYHQLIELYTKQCLITPVVVAIYF